MEDPVRLLTDTVATSGDSILAVSLAFFWQTCGSQIRSA